MLNPFLSSGFSFDNLLQLVLRVVMVLLAISAHELAHGFAAYKLGDPTAKYDGRLSLNPLRHIDPIGALCMFFFGFGWAKPVMVNPNYFKNLKRDTRLTALAGPLSNILLAYIFMLLGIHVGARLLHSAWMQMLCYNFIIINIGLGVFNLLPIPPLDGSKIFLSLLPRKIYYEIMRYERFGFLVLAVALYLGVLDPIIFGLQSTLYRILFTLAGGAFLS